MSFQGQRRGSGLHAVGGIDIIFDQDGNPVQQSAYLPCLALRVESIGDFQGIRIQLDDRINVWTVLVDFLDALHVQLGESTRRQLARFHFLLKIRDRPLRQNHPDDSLEEDGESKDVITARL